MSQELEVCHTHRVEKIS